MALFIGSNFKSQELGAKVRAWTPGSLLFLAEPWTKALISVSLGGFHQGKEVINEAFYIFTL